MPTSISHNSANYNPVVNKPAEIQQPIQNPADIVVPPPSKHEDGSNMLMNTLTGLALIGTAAYLGYNYLKGRGANAEKTLEAFKQQGGKFEKGIAMLKDGTKFTGTIIHKAEKSGNEYYRQYVNGQLITAGKNMDASFWNNPAKPTVESFCKQFNYSPEGKLISYDRYARNGDTIVKSTHNITPKNIVTRENFIKGGGKFNENGIPQNADGSNFKGFIVDYNGNSTIGQNTIIKEYADGKQVSERFNISLKDRVIGNRKDTYNLDEQGLIQREQDLIRQEQERIAKEKEMQKLSYKVKTLFKNLFSKNSKTETV